MALAGRKSAKRTRLTVQGIVQGVGFRPFVYGLAMRLGLRGFVLNDSAGVTIEIEGEEEKLAEFCRLLREKAPPLSRVESVVEERVAAHGDTTFVIAHSQAGAERNTLISPDTCTCSDCQSETFDPQDRRYRYPFTNCTNCGPRFTIVEDVPYDRPFTTMKIFPMCPQCQSEYEDPLNRRFHAQPNACPVCGPHVTLLDANGKIIEEKEALREAAKLLAQGVILAVKGLGGYHLACDALNAEAVTRLRQRKHREAKPFALMVGNIETARKLAKISPAEEELLASLRRPIVLLERLSDCAVPVAVSPGLKTLGLMLPYTPLHFLLLKDFAEQSKLPALVMTSGNMSDEPIAYRDEDASTRLSTIAEGALIHNRPIHMRCDDSIARVAAGGVQLFRRARGYAPEPLKLPFESPAQILAVGGHLKNTFCLTKGRQAFVSHHIGDLENLETLISFREGIEHFKRLFDINPAAVAYDLHPEYLATKYALELDLPKIGVQHHHAHIAGVMAENGLVGTVIGVAADGTGYGLDGRVWGCEIMLARLSDFDRMSYLDYIPLPGGEQAVYQPWRLAAVYLQKAYGSLDNVPDIAFTSSLDRKKWEVLSKMIAQGLNSPPASSLGRLFDAASALLEVRREALYEGQAAIELEALAKTDYYIYPVETVIGALDVAPMIRAMVEDLHKGVRRELIAGRFHRSVAELLAQTCQLVREKAGESRVVLSGGVFQNRLLLETLKIRLEELGFKVYINRQVPPNDGGLSYGQAVVAAARLIDKE
jgi:hydrogenase maturation protein HypF